MSRSRSATPDSARSRGSSRGSSSASPSRRGGRGSASPSPSRKLEPKSKNVLNAQNLARLDLHNLLSGHLEEPDLDYPCKDKSKNVNDFRDWSYFKRPQFHEPPVNAKHSFLWNSKLLERISKQNEYLQYEPEPKLTGYKETRTNLDRKKRAKQMLARWKKKPLPTYASANDGTLTGRTDTATLGLSSMSIAGGGKGSAAATGPGQSRGRGRSSASTGPGGGRAASASSRGQTRSPDKRK